MSLHSPWSAAYKYYSGGDVLYPFGFGLTYTTWAITASPATLGALPATVSVTLRNTGAVSSDEVVMSFLVPRFNRTGVATPRRQLIDFRRVHVAAGAQATLSFQVSKEQLELVRADGSRSLEVGPYELQFTNGATCTATISFRIPVQ